MEDSKESRPGGLRPQRTGEKLKKTKIGDGLEAVNGFLQTFLFEFSGLTTAVRGRPPLHKTSLEWKRERDKEKFSGEEALRPWWSSCNVERLEMKR